MRSCCPEREAGFSLIEVLLALAIVGLMLGATAGVFRNGILGHANAGDAAMAASLAEQRLAEAGVTAALRPGESQGTFGRFRWHVTVADYADKDEPRDAAALPRRGRGRMGGRAAPAASSRLSTLRLAPPP